MTPPSHGWSRALVRAAVGDLPRDGPGIADLTRLLVHARRTTTMESYDSKIRRFVDFCLNDWPAAGYPALRPLPAQQSTILAYIGSLFEDGLQASSLQPYLSAINSWHADLHLPPPARGHLVTLARKGYAELEGEETVNLERRGPIAVDVILDIVVLGMRTASRRTLRAATAIAVAFLFFARADTGVRLLRRDIALDAHGIHLRAQAKTRSRLDPLLLTAPWPHPIAGHDMPFIHSLLARFLASTAGARDDAPLWQLSTDNAASWRPALVEVWLQHLLKTLQRTPPLGTLWTKHSLRSAGATAALSVGVDVFTIARLGGWASIESVKLYVDPFVVPHLYSFLVFGPWLRKSLDAVLAAHRQVRSS